MLLVFLDSLYSLFDLVFNSVQNPSSLNHENLAQAFPATAIGPGSIAPGLAGVDYINSKC